MDISYIKDFLLSHMINAKLVSGGRTINCRCPLCGDSVHQKSAHFYISLPTKNAPMLYYCHKCNSGGVVTYKSLLEWGLYDQKVVQEIECLNKMMSRKIKARRYYDFQVRNISNNKITQDSKSAYKLNYINQRLGLRLGYQDLSQLKIVLNLHDLLSENHIDTVTRNENIVADLDREFIGFLSFDNCYMNMRITCEPGIGRVYKEVDKRYINYAIFEKPDNSMRFYTIPTIVNLNTPCRIPIHIAEGPFDILSVYMNLCGRSNGIYTSVAGNNYISVISHFLINLQIPNCELHFYPDKDKYGTIERIIGFLDRIPDKSFPVFYHINNMDGEKDFGVPIQRIQESIMKLR